MKQICSKISTHLFDSEDEEYEDRWNVLERELNDLLKRANVKAEFKIRENRVASYRKDGMYIDLEIDG